MIYLEGWLRTREIWTVQRRFLKTKGASWEIIKEFATIEGAEKALLRLDMDAMPDTWEFRVQGFKIGKEAK